MKSPITEARERIAALLTNEGHVEEAEAVTNGDRDNNYKEIADAKTAYLREVSYKAGFARAIEVLADTGGADVEEEWKAYSSLFEMANTVQSSRNLPRKHAQEA